MDLMSPSIGKVLNAFVWQSVKVWHFLPSEARDGISLNVFSLLRYTFYQNNNFFMSDHFLDTLKILLLRIMNAISTSQFYIPILCYLDRYALFIYIGRLIAFAFFGFISKENVRKK